jgi:hypothetical protein
MTSMGRDPSYSGPDKYSYKTSYNQDRDGNFYSGNRDYSKDGGSVEFSRTSTHVRDSDADRNRGSYQGGAVYSGSVSSPYGQQVYSRGSDQDGNRYSSSYSNYDSRGRNQDSQYSSGLGAYAGGASYNSSSSYGGNQSYPRSYESRNQDDNKYSSNYSSQPVYYKQETKTYYNDDNQRPSYGQNYSSNYSSNNCGQNRDSDYNSSRGYSSGQSGAQGQYQQYSSSRY